MYIDCIGDNSRSYSEPPVSAVEHALSKARSIHVPKSSSNGSVLGLCRTLIAPHTDTVQKRVYTMAL